MNQVIERQMNAKQPDIGDRNGFSLIELLIVMTIAALLLSFAVPAWQQVMMSARRTEATAALHRTASRQEQFRLQQKRYAGADELARPPPDGLGLDNTVTGHYVLATKLSDSGYTATATARAGSPQQHDTRCRLFGIDATGRRWAETNTGEDSTLRCWKS
jgi:type IV pilus assembly protein PilE